MFNFNDLVCLFVLVCCALILAAPALLSKRPENYRTALGINIVMICIIVGTKYALTLEFWGVLK